MPRDFSDHRRVDDFSQSANYQYPRNDYRKIKQPHHSKNRASIMLKSSVIAMGIVFAVLLVAYFFIKSNRARNSQIIAKKVTTCAEYKPIAIAAEVAEIQNTDDGILVVTKPYNIDDAKEKKSSQKMQQVVKFDGKCGKELARFSFIIE